MQPDSTTQPVGLPLAGFLNILYQGLEGYIYAPFLDRETGTFSEVFVRTSNLARLEKHIKEMSVTTDVYLAPAVFSEPRISRQTFAASNVCWVEFDDETPKEITPTPSINIRSSLHNHNHCYWVLDEPITDFTVLEEVNRGLTFTLGADQSGWDCTQILRPPETHNFKRDLPVVVTALSGNICNLGEFTKFHAPPMLDEDSIELKTIPDVMEVIYTYALGLDFKDVFTATPGEGSRSTYLVRVGYYAAEAGCTNEEIYSLLRNCDDRWGKYSKREDRHRRLLDIIERVRDKYPILGSETSEAIDVLDIISFGNQSIQVEWLLPGLLQAGGNFLLVGPPGVGKTQIALNFAYGLATHTEILGYRAQAPKRVLFVSCEMPAPDLKVFTDAMTPRFSDTPEKLMLLSENFFVHPRGEPMYLNTKEQQDNLRRIIDTLNLDGIIFDSLGSATNKSLSDEESVKALTDWNDKLRQETGVFTWYIHHNRKATESNKEPSGLYDVFGSQYITARATTVLSLWPQERNVLKVRELKVRLAPQKDDWYIKRSTGLSFNAVSADAVSTVPKKTTTIGQAINDKPSNPFNI